MTPKDKVVMIQIGLVKSELSRVEREFKDGYDLGQHSRALEPAKDVVALSKALLDLVKSGLRS